jgi:hypothetical protein
MFILVTSPKCPAIFGRHSHRSGTSNVAALFTNSICGCLLSSINCLAELQITPRFLRRFRNPLVKIPTGWKSCIPIFTVLLKEPIFTALLKNPLGRGRGAHQLSHPTSATPIRSGIADIPLYTIGKLEIPKSPFPVFFSSSISGKA